MEEVRAGFGEDMTLMYEWFDEVGCRSEPGRVSDLRHEPAILDLPEAVVAPPILREGDEEVASRTVDEVQAHIGGDLVVQAVVLEENA